MTKEPNPQFGDMRQANKPGPRGCLIQWHEIYTGTEWINAHTQEGENLFVKAQAARAVAQTGGGWN